MLKATRPNELRKSLRPSRQRRRRRKRVHTEKQSNGGERISRTPKRKGNADRFDGVGLRCRPTRRSNRPRTHVAWKLWRFAFVANSTARAPLRGAPSNRSAPLLRSSMFVFERRFGERSSHAPCWSPSEDVKKSRQRQGREDRKGRIFRKDALRALRSLRST